jgi:hypothetical protein
MVGVKTVSAKRVNADSPGSYLINYNIYQSYGLGVESVQGRVGSRLGASVLLAVR